ARAARTRDRADARGRPRALREGRAHPHPRQAADATARAQARGRALPALRDDLEVRALRGLRDRLLPALPDGGPRAQGPAPVAAAEVSPRGRRLLETRRAA